MTRFLIFLLFSHMGRDDRKISSFFLLTVVMMRVIQFRFNFGVHGPNGLLTTSTYILFVSYTNWKVSFIFKMNAKKPVYSLSSSTYRNKAKQNRDLMKTFSMIFCFSPPFLSLHAILLLRYAPHLHVVE